MDLQATLRLKDAELEQRAALLLKTKAAIEQLQEELAGARQEVDKWRRAAERQGGELADAQHQVQVLEAEVEAKCRESTALLADMLDLKRQLQEAQDGLHSANDSQSAQHATFMGRLREAERELAISQADTKAVREQAAALQVLVADRERGLAEQAAAQQSLDQQRGQLEAASMRLAEQLAVAQSQGHEAAAAAEQAHGRLVARAQQLEDQLVREVEARQRAEQAAAAAKEALADEQRRLALEGSAWERRLRELQQDAAERLQGKEAAWVGQREVAQREAAAAMEEARRQLTKRLYLAEGEWARKLQQSSAEWAAKLDTMDSQWLRRCEADKATWAAERARLVEELEGHLADAEQAGKAAVEETKQHYRRKMAAAEAKAATAAQAADWVWHQRLEAAAAKAQEELKAAADSCATTAAKQEQQLASQLTAMQEASASKLAEQDKQWALRLASAEERALREKHELERQWADKLHATDKAAGEMQASLRSQLEEHLAAVTLRVGAIAQKEGKQERKRAELLCRVAELEASGEGERGRRRELEDALQEASSIFKRELADKSQQLDLLRQEIRFLRSWAGAEAGSATALPSVVLPAMSVTATVASLSPTRTGSPCAAAVSPSFAHGYWACGGGSPTHVHCCSAPVSPAHNAAASAAAAARAVEAEVRALRSARRAYERVTLGQQDLATSVARTINEALRRKEATAAASLPPPPLRPHSAGSGYIPAAGRRKWKRDLAAELQGLC